MTVLIRHDHPTHEIAVALIGLLLMALNFLGVGHQLYDIYWWYDIPMHLLGGAWVALVAVVIYYSNRFSSKRHTKKRFAVLLGLVVAFLVGSAWEVYEVAAYNIPAGVPFDLVDSVADVFNDLLGAWVALMLFVLLPKTRRIIERQRGEPLTV